MYNTPVYSLADYVKRYRAACVAVVRMRKFGSTVIVHDDNNRPWTVIIDTLGIEGSKVYHVRHAHFEDYQNWQPM